MKKVWIIGIILALSLGLNALMGGMLIGQKAPRLNAQPLAPRLVNLAAEQRKALRAEHGEALKALRLSMREVRQKRRDLAAYIKSPDYNRTEAERRMLDIRTQHLHAQEMAHRILLDVADDLSPQDRAKLLKGRTAE